MWPFLLMKTAKLPETGFCGFHKYFPRLSLDAIRVYGRVLATVFLHAEEDASGSVLRSACLPLADSARTGR